LIYYIMQYPLTYMACAKPKHPAVDRLKPHTSTAAVLSSALIYYIMQYPLTYMACAKPKHPAVDRLKPARLKGENECPKH
jgi:hypothetical protein